MSERVDWTTTDGCERCNEHGPFDQLDSMLTFSREKARDAHQAWHGLVAELLRPIVRLLERLS